MRVIGLEIFLGDMCLGQSLLQIVLFQDGVLDEIRVGYVVEDGISQDFKSFILDREAMVLLERFVGESLQKHWFVLELISQDLLNREKKIDESFFEFPLSHVP